MVRMTKNPPPEPEPEPDGLPRDMIASGWMTTPAFTGPGSSVGSVELKVPIALDPRTVLWMSVDGERATPRPVIEHADGVLTGFTTRVTRRWRTLRIEVIVERTGPGEEPTHTVAFYIFSGPWGLSRTMRAKE